VVVVPAWSLEVVVVLAVLVGPHELVPVVMPVPPHELAVVVVPD